MESREVKRTEYTYHNRDDLVARVLETTRDWRGKTVLIAGHYMVTYRASQDRLVPLMKAFVSDELAASSIEKEYLRDVGDFPEATFELALRLAKDRDDGAWKIAVAVDDYLFQKFQSDAPSGEPAAQLRREFYRRNRSLPAPFLEIASKYPEVDVDAFLEYNHAKRPAAHLLPSETFYFSETSHRNRFGNARKQWLLGRPGFHRSVGPVERGAVYFQRHSRQKRACLIREDNKITCSGAMIEFLLELTEKGARNVLLFIPGDCRREVDLSIEVTLSMGLPLANGLAVWEEGVTPDGLANLSAATGYETNG